MTDKLKNIANKVRSHSHTASFLIAIAVMTFFCAASRITPFGDNTFLYDDMRREYIRYYAHLSSALHGQGSMIYSSEKGLGGSMLGLYVSYISSPLNLIYALFPVKYYPEVLTFLTILRFGLMSLTADIFLRYIGLKKTIPFALSFGLSLYVFATLINPEWMDLLIFFPLFMISAVRLSKDPGSTRAFITHTLVTAAMLFINYYLSYMVLIFLALFMIIRTFLRKISPYALFRVFISTVAGILLVMPILLPVLRELMLSEKDIGDTSLLQRLADHFILTDPLKVFSRLFTLSLDERQFMFGMPHLFCGMVIIPLAILFFIYKEIPLKDKIESLILMMILSASFCIRSLDLLWHVGNDPNGYYERYAFLFTSIMVVCAARAWNTGVIRIKSLTAAFSVTAFFMLLVYFRSESLGISWYSGKKMAAGMILLALEYLLILLMTGVAGATDKTGATGATDMTKLTDETGRTDVTDMTDKADATGVTDMTGVTGVTDKTDGTGGTGRMGFRVRAAAAGVLMVLCMADLLWNQHVLMASAVIPSEPDSQYRAELSAKSALVDSIKEKDDYFFYRIEDTYSDTYDCLNDSMVYRYNGLSHYSTGDHLSVRMFLKAAGFNYNGLMDVYNPENTDTCDSFLDIKYLLTSKGVYTNENVFPAAVKTTGEVPSDIIMDSPFEFQKQIASAFSGKDCRDLFFPAEILSDEIMTTDDSQILIREIRLKTGCPGDLYFYIRNLGKKPQDMAVSVDGSFISGYANASAIKILDLGTFDEGQECTVSLTLRGDPEKAVFGDPQFCTENLSVLDTLSKEAKERGLQVSEPSPSEYFIENPENNSILLSIPYEESFRAYGTESGETYSISPAFGALTLINDVANEPVILEYTVPWFKQGMLAMLAGITLVLISSLPSLLRRKKES